MNYISLIITAAGSSSRFGGKNKCLELINGITVLETTINTFLKFKWNEIIITSNEESKRDYEKLISKYDKDIKIISGGKTRFESVKKAVQHTMKTSINVVIHDAARPYCSYELIEKILKEKHEKGLIPGINVVDTIKETDSDNNVIRTPKRSTLRAIQTPQFFCKKTLLNCYNNDYECEITDESILLEINNIKVKVIEGEMENIKITYKNDL